MELDKHKFADAWTTQINVGIARMLGITDDELALRQQKREDISARSVGKRVIVRGRGSRIITLCSSCPHFRIYWQMGPAETCCSHHKAPKGYGSMVEPLIYEHGFPEWCPLPKETE